MARRSQRRVAAAADSFAIPAQGHGGGRWRGPSQWLGSRRFLRDYRKASGPLRNLAEQEVRHLRETAGTHADWAGNYDRIQVASGRILELELGGGPRLLAHWDASDRVVLLAMGDHEVVRRFQARGSVAIDTASTVPLPAAFQPGHRSTFFPAVASGNRGHVSAYANDMTSEWLYFLDDEQSAICEALVDRIETALLEGRRTVDFVMGGPGTGKTSVLLQLLTLLSDIGGGRETWTLGLDVSDEVAAFITAATGWELDAVRAAAKQVGRGQNRVDVVLVDDPSSTRQVERYASLAEQGSVGSVVAGFDPLQLNESVTDEHLDALARNTGAELHALQACYRQKEAVGRVASAAAEVVARSTPFAKAEKVAAYAKERRELTDLANSVEYRNPSGLATTHVEPRLREWADHLAWVARQESNWRFWDPLLVLVDEGVHLPDDWERALAGVRHRRLPLGDIPRVKGLEYQHVAIVLSRQRHQDIERGFSGTGRRLYDDYRLLRIPFSRAKDSLTVWVL